MADNNKRSGPRKEIFWKKNNSKKVTCDECGGRVYFYQLKNIGGRFDRYLVCRSCYARLY